MRYPLLVTSFLVLAVTACAEPPVAEPSVLELSVGEHSLRLQAGSKLITYGVTEDGFVLFQDGPRIYASIVLPGAPRHLVAEVGANQPVVLIRGRVAFIWTQQFYFGRGGVSPLVVWSARGGARDAGSSVVSVVGTRFAAVRPDSEEILYVTHASADGAVGDIVGATPDLRVVRTLAEGVDINVRGACPPLVGFDGRARPIVAACPAGTTVATLTRWVDGAPRVLSADLVAPPVWSSDARGERFFTIVGGAARTPVLVDRRGVATVLENIATRTGFINGDGAVLTSNEANGGELHRITGNPPRVEVVAPLGNTIYFIGRHFQGFRQYTDSAVSRDARLMLTADVFDPATGLRNLSLVDVSGTPFPSIQLERDAVAGQSFEIFTRDSRFGLYYRSDPATSSSTLMAASLDGQLRALSSGAANENEHYAMGDSLVAFSDNLNGTGIDLLDLHDIVVADAAADPVRPRTVAPGAYNLFFPTPGRRALVYTSDHDPARSGLFIVPVR